MIITSIVIASLIAARKQIMHIFSNIDYVLIISILTILIGLSAFMYYSLILYSSSIIISL
jgi:hypothetical protein